MKLMRQNYLLIDLGNTYVKVYDKNEQLIYREFTTNVEAIDTKLMTLNADAIIYSKVLNPFCQKIIENFKIPSHDIRNIVLEKKALLPTFKNFNLNELGTDIILGIMGAISKGYEDFIIVDDGTACTLSVVKTSEFLGVNIYPGWDNLKNHFKADTQIDTSNIQITSETLGIDTNSALYNGIYKMYWESLNNDIKKYQKYYKIDVCLNITNEIVLGFKYLINL